MMKKKKKSKINYISALFQPNLINKQPPYFRKFLEKVCFLPFSCLKKPPGLEPKICSAPCAGGRLPCGTKFLRLLIFEIFLRFLLKIRKTKRTRKKKFPQKFTPVAKLYIPSSEVESCRCHLFKIKVSFVQKQNDEMRKKTSRNKRKG